MKKYGSLGDISVLYLLPLVLYVPIGFMIHMYWFAGSTLTSKDYTDFQKYIYFGAIYFSCILIYMVITATYQWVRLHYIENSHNS